MASGESKPTSEETQAVPALADPEAAHRVGDALRGRFAESIDSTGKALAALAGLGAFFVGAGYFVEWQRLRQGRLPSEEVLPLIPNDQIAAAGVRELAISVIYVGVTLVVLGFILARIVRWAQGRTGVVPRVIDWTMAKGVAVPTAFMGGITLLIVPLGGFGLLITAILTGLFYYGLRLISRFLKAGEGAEFPLWRLALAVGLAAVVLAGARQAEFPERRADVLVCLTNGEEFEGDYIASDSDKILIRKRVISKGLFKRSDRLTCATNRREKTRREKRQRQGKRPRLIVVPSDTVREMQLAGSPQPLPYKSSLLDRIVSRVPGLPEIEFTCIPPECRWGGDTRIGPSTYF